MVVRSTPAPAGRLCLTFDDGTEHQWDNVRPNLLAYDIPATFYVSGGLIGTGSYLTLAHAQQLVVDGHEIGNHAWLHDNFDGQTFEAIYQNLADNKSYIENTIGYAGPSSFAYPGAGANGTNKLLQQAVKELGYGHERITSDELQMPPWPFRTPVRSLTTAEGTAKVDVILNRVAAGEWVVMYCHTISPTGSWTVEQWNYLCAQIIARSIPVYRAGDLGSEIWPQKANVLLNPSFAYEVTGANAIGWNISSGTWPLVAGGATCTTTGSLAVLFQRVAPPSKKIRLQGTMTLTGITGTGVYVTLWSYADNKNVWGTGNKTGTQTVTIDETISLSPSAMVPHPSSAYPQAQSLYLALNLGQNITGGSCVWGNFSITASR